MQQEAIKDYVNVRKLYFNIKWEVMERGNGNERKYISVKCKFWHFISKLRLRHKLRILELQYQVSTVIFLFYNLSLIVVYNKNSEVIWNNTDIHKTLYKLHLKKISYRTL